MSQSEIIEFLEKFKKPVSRSEIASALSKDMILISHSIARLVKSKEIKVIEIDRHQAMELYHCKRRMRLYYL